MPGNPCDMITTAERRFPVRIRVGVPQQCRPTAYTNNRLPRRKLRCRRLGRDPIGDPRRAQRRDLALLR
jgi:hypothetical protein